MPNIIEKARDCMRRYRAAMGEVSDTVAMTVPELFEAWSADGTYSVNERVRHGELLYKCLTAHTAQEGWKPPDAPSLWVRIDDPAVAFPEWRQPAGSTDAYPLGAKVSHNSKHWESIVDNNVWEPGVYGWNEVV